MCDSCRYFWARGGGACLCNALHAPSFAQYSRGWGRIFGFEASVVRLQRIAVISAKFAQLRFWVGDDPYVGRIERMEWVYVRFAI